jgi:hypothetical protein
MVVRSLPRLIIGFQLIGIVTDFQVFIGTLVATIGAAGGGLRAIDFAKVETLVGLQFRTMRFRTQ